MQAVIFDFFNKKMNFKTKKRERTVKTKVAVIIFASAILFTGVFSSLLLFKNGKTKQKTQNGVYKMTLALSGNTLLGELLYCENENNAEGENEFVFCLQPNFLYGGDFSKNGAKKKDNEASENENAKKAENDITAETNDLKDLPLKILSAGGEKCEYLKGGSYLKTDVKTENGKKFAKINFQTDILNGDDRLSITETGINLANFYPYKCAYDKNSHKWITFDKAKTGDPFFNEFADYEIKLNVPSTYTVAGAAAERCTVNGEKTIYEYDLKNYTQAAFCLSENFEVISKKWGDKSINCYYVKNFGQNSAEKESANFYDKSTLLAIDALDFFKNNYGDYPRKSYSIAFVPFFCGGMEYPALSIVSAKQNVENSLKAIVHETAHQWFPLTVGNNEYSEGYFDEGLAEFLSYKYFSFKKSPIAKSMLDSAAKTVKNYTDNVRAEMKMNKKLCEFSSEYEYYATAYARGLVLFYECEKLSGEKKFAAKLREFLSANKFCTITADDFAKTLNPKTKKAFFSIVESKALLCLPNK